MTNHQRLRRDDGDALMLSAKPPEISQSTPTWELCKENAAPLQRGRNVAVLEQSFSLATAAKMAPVLENDDDASDERNRRIQHFERLVAPSELQPINSSTSASCAQATQHTATAADDEEEADEDPLIHWMSYIKYVQEHFPSDTHLQFLLMERCTRALVHNPRYANDVRFIRVCVMYADKTATPAEIFQYLYQQRVGRQVTLFWMAWAWVAEHAGNYAWAEKIFKKAFQNQPHPSAQLKRRYDQFIRRMSRHWLNTSAASSNSNAVVTAQQSEFLEDEQDGSMSRHQRLALGGLDEDQVRRNQRSTASALIPNATTTTVATAAPTFIDRRQALASRERDRPSNNGVVSSSSSSLAFPIFVEANDDHRENSFTLDPPSQDAATIGHYHRRVLEREVDRKKENTQKPETWNHRPGGYTSMYPASLPTMPATSSAPTIPVVQGRQQLPVSFDIHVDEACIHEIRRQEHVQQQLLEQQRRHRDERTFRERPDGRMADKLTIDPLRYVKNPSKLDAEQVDEQHYHPMTVHAVDQPAEPLPATASHHPTKKPPSAALLPATQQLLQTYTSFEEARASLKSFKLVTAETNFNLLMVSLTTTTRCDDSSMDIEEESQSIETSRIYNSKEEDDDHCDSISASHIRGDQSVGSLPQKLQRPPAHGGNYSLRRRQHTANGNSFPIISSTHRSTLPQRVLFSANASFDSQTTKIRGVDVSNTSSIEGQAEETINTKFAVKELSVMFASPAYLGIQGPYDTERSNTEDDDRNDCHNVAIANSDTAGITDEDINYRGSQSFEECRNSSVASYAHNEEGNHDAIMRMTQSPDTKENLGPNNPNPRSITEPGFDAMALQTLETDQRQLHSITCRGAATETTHHRLANVQDDPFRGQVVEMARDPGFSIYCDDDDQVAKHDDERKPPAIMLTQSPRFSVNSNATKACLHGRASVKQTFSIFQDDVIDDHDGKTALPPVSSTKEPGDDHVKAMSVVPHPEYSVRDSTKALADTLPKDAAPLSSNVGFSIWVDDADNDEDHVVKYPSQFGPSMEIVVKDDGDGFGDISHIAPATPSVALPCSMATEQPELDYEMIHQRDVRRALAIIRERGIGKPVPNTKNDLLSMLSATGFVCHLPDQPIPRGLQTKILTKGTEVKLGHRSGIIKAELGRGAYGIVALLGPDDTKKSERSVAVKIQTPADCLALEYDILQKIESRIGKLGSTDPFPFPRPLSFLSLADGGLMSMTAGSTSGMNLVDLSNVYRIQERAPFPELLALHYAARMLKHTELLHNHGKILHCDAKPDNWVMTTSASAYPTCQEAVLASDLMLVDFGLSVDLATLDDNPSHFHRKSKGRTTETLPARLRGSTAGERDMACPAMRQGLGWCFEADFFGICASVHVLLFGGHIEIVKEDDTERKHWRLKSPLRRYWQRNLWENLFDTLLNYREVSENCLVPFVDREEKFSNVEGVLRSLRASIEAYLQTRCKELDAMLKHQARKLPTKRLG